MAAFVYLTYYIFKKIYFDIKNFIEGTLILINKMLQIDLFFSSEK